MNEFFKFILAETTILSGISCTIISYHHDEDLALIKVLGAVSDRPITECDFLPIADQITQQKFNGFVVSYCDDFFANQNPDLESTRFTHIKPNGDISIEKKRVISIHEFEKKSAEIISVLPGVIDSEEKRKELMIATGAYALFKDQQQLIKSKSIMQEGVFSFPSLANGIEFNLMSAMHFGASGSPLVVKQNGQFKIKGILTKGAKMPRSWLEKSDTIALTSDGKLVHVNHFLDITPLAGWINKQIDELNKRLDDIG